MENNLEQYNPEEDIEESLNYKNNINNMYSDNNIMSQNNLENVNYRKEDNSDYSSLLNKYKILNMDNFKNKNINMDNQDNNIRDKIINNNQKNIISEKEMTQINNDYTKQINDIISKNFKNGLDWSQNIYNNSYINNNSNNSNYLELERERKLLLLKNIELEKEINNLNNFVDFGHKTTYNSTNPNSKVINKSNNNTRNSYNISNISSKNQNIKNKNNTSMSYYTKYRNKNEKKKDYKQEINEAQNTIKILDNRIKILKNEINKHKSMNNKYSDKIKEIKIWRETFYEEFYKYKNLLKDLKENLNNDKILYNNVIWKMKQKASDNINIIYENYKNQIAENEKKLDFLKKENEKLTIKENKVKEIYLYNFK